jgi:curved DNA-binding protein CbpA
MSEFIDHYEVLEISQNASFETIERVFRYLAKRFHPDSSESGDIKKFSAIVEAYEVLSDPAARANFDNEYDEETVKTIEIVEGAGSVGDDTADRHKLLSLFYAQRRRSTKEPGMGITTVESMMGIPVEVLEFHLWFFREKGWIQREEGGTISITASGVEKLENSTEAQAARNLKRITAGDSRVEHDPAAATGFTGMPGSPAAV